MPDLKLTLACWNYDRTRALIDGRVKPEGIDLDIKLLRPRQTFQRMLDDREFQVSELSLAGAISRGLVAAGEPATPDSGIFQLPHRESDGNRRPLAASGLANRTPSPTGTGSRRSRQHIGSAS